MVNSFPHVHSFRLSDEDERYYKALLRKFQIFSSNQSVAFRKLLRELSSLLRDLDEDAASPSLSPSAAQSQPDADEEELDIYEMEPHEDQGDDPHYKQFRMEATHRIIARGSQPLTYENILAEVRAIKKEKGIQS